MLKRQVAVTPPPQWVRVVGGFTEHQFAEKRLPTLEEINAVAPETPVFILHLYDRALLNAAALRAVGYTKDTPNPPGGEIERDAGRQADRAAAGEAQRRHPLCDARQGAEAAVRISAQLDPAFHARAQPAGRHRRDRCRRRLPELSRGLRGHREAAPPTASSRCASPTTCSPRSRRRRRRTSCAGPGSSKYQQGDDYFRLNGAGEMLVFSAADFEDFRQPRPDMPPEMEGELEAVVRILAQNRWPWRLHATYDETITRALDVFEKVNQDIPLQGLNWFFDHAETISEQSIDRIAALGGGIAVQHRMAYQGEYFVERYGAGAAEATPPVARMLEKGVKVCAGTDATRVASYNPWVSLAWLVTGRTVGGLRLYPQRNCLDRETALRLWTENVTWFSNEEGKKGQIEVGQLADLAVPDRDYFACAENEIADTVVRADDGRRQGSSMRPATSRASRRRRRRPCRTGRRCAASAATPPGASRAASGCSARSSMRRAAAPAAAASTATTTPRLDRHRAGSDLKSFWGALGCSCFAF